MPTSTKYSLPVSPLTFNEKSSSSRRNTVDAYDITSLNTLDDDVNRIEDLIGIAADGLVASLSYGSPTVVTNGTDLATAIGALDTQVGNLASNTVVSSVVDLTGTIYTLGHNTSWTINATTDVVTSNTHNLVVGQPVRVRNSGGALPTGISSGTTYYAGTITTNTFKLYPTSGDASSETNAINATDAGTGVHYFDGTYVVGASSLFSSELSTGDYVFVSGVGTVKVSSIGSNTVFSTDSSFPFQSNTNASAYEKVQDLALPLVFSDTLPLIPITTPVFDQHIASKKYVDDQISGVNVESPQRYYSGKAPYYNDASSIIIPASAIVRDSTNMYDIDFSGGAATVALTTSGANGRDTGTEAGNTWYYVYAISDSTGSNAAAGLLSTVNESVTGSVTLPSGYDIKAQLPLALRNDGSSNLIPFIILGWTANSATVQWMVDQAGMDATVGPTNVVDGGTATSNTAVTCTSYVPTGIADQAWIRAQAGRSTSSPFDLYIVDNNFSSEFHESEDGRDFTSHVWVTLDGSGQFDYRHASATGVDLSVLGYRSEIA